MAASQRSLVQDQIADVTECSICTEIFTNPKILPCVHTFCLHCLETYGKDKNPGDQMVCPICRKEFLIPYEGFCHLPNNFFIGKVVEIGKLASAPTSKSLCALCSDDDEVLAELFCVDCEQNLCSRCGKGHKKSRFSQHHQIVELGGEPKAQELNLRNSYCDHHPGEMIKMFCYEDNVAICLVCCVESHQSHRCVNVNKAAGEFREQIRDSTEKVINRLSECQEFGETLDKFKKEFQAEVLKTEGCIRDTSNKVTKLIEQHTELLIQNLKLVKERNIKAFEITAQDFNRFKVMIDSFSRYSEELLTRGSPVDICRAVNQMLTRAHELETLPANCSGGGFCCDAMVFHPLQIDTLYGLKNAVGDLAVTQSSDWLLKFDRETFATDDLLSDESTLSKGSRLSGARHVEGKCSPKEMKSQSASSNSTIIVWQIPHKLNEDLLRMIFESKRNGGGKIDDVSYNQENGTAVITFEDPNDAKALVEKGSVTYKNHTLVISRPSKPKPVEEVKESAQPPFTHEDKRGTPDEYSTGQEQTIGESTTFDVSNIPEDMSEDTLRMIFENKRFGGGGEVTNIDYEKGRGLAVITLSDPEVAKKLVHQESVVFKGSRLMITKHIEEDRSQKPFPSRKRNNFPTSEKEQPSISDRILKVSNIPSGFNKDTLVMLFESKRNGGGDTDNIVYDQQKGTAVITFKDPEVAKTLIVKEVLIYKGNRLAITKSTEEPDESAKQEQISSVSSRMVDVSEIPPDMTTAIVRAIEIVKGVTRKQAEKLFRGEIEMN